MTPNPDPTTGPFPDPQQGWITPGDSTYADKGQTHGESGNETRAFSDDSQADTLAIELEPRRRPVVVVLEGAGAGEQVVLQKDITVLGREMDVDMVLKDGRVSRSHARILWENINREPEEPRCVIDDLESRNGVFVNGQKVKHHPLRDGDRILLGGTLVGYYVKDQQELNIDQRLLTMATTDSLTGLANRMFFDSEARREIDRAQRYERPLSFLAMDLDHFKRVNDTYGHPAGDTVLRQFARLLLVTVRQGDLIGRMGGEEFGALLPETPLEGALRSAERIRERTEARVFQHKDQKISITVSIGVAQFGPPFEGRTAFFEATDKALYEAKQLGRNRVCHVELPDRPASSPDANSLKRE